MKVLFYRAFLDTTKGGYYSPLHEDLKCASLIPPAELPLTPKRLSIIPSWLNPYKVIDSCTGNPIVKFMPWDKKWVLHNDPRLDLGFLTDRPIARGGRIPWGIVNEGIVIFVSGLITYPKGFWEIPRRFVEIKRFFRESMENCRASLYAVGGLVIKDFIDILEVGWKKAIEKYPCLEQSPNYWYLDPEVIVLIGEPFKLRPPVKLYTFCNWKIGDALIDLLGPKLAEKTARNLLKKTNPLSISDPIEILEKYAKVEFLRGKTLPCFSL